MSSGEDVDAVDLQTAEVIHELAERPSGDWPGWPRRCEALGGERDAARLLGGNGPTHSPPLELDRTESDRMGERLVDKPNAAPRHYSAAISSSFRLGARTAGRMISSSGSSRSTPSVIQAKIVS
jgi:hypothetical protein